VAAVVSMKALLETGVHFGHRTRRWNPKMKPYIFTERSGVHILDLQQTIAALDRAYRLVRDTVAEGGTLLFVGTKRQARDTIAAEAIRCSMPYVNTRWLGGTLTNWRTIRQRIEYLLALEARRDRGEFERLTKREALLLTVARFRSSTPAYPILVVDDNPADREIIGEMLRAGNYSFETCEGGEQAIRWLNEHRASLVLLDLMMPQVSGFDVLAHIRQTPALNDLPVLIVSAKDLTAEEKAFLNGGIADIIQKQALAQADLRERIARALG